MTFADRLTPLKVANFRWFFIGESINTAGSSMSGVALAFAVLSIDKSASALGMVVAAQAIPTVAFMLIGGALADRLPRSLVLRGCNFLEGLIQAVAAILVLTGVAQVWHLVILQFLAGTVFAVSYPAFHGMVPILLPQEQRKSAYLLIAQSNGLLSIGGPAISGVLVATVGPGWALGFDAATFLAASVFLSLLRLPRGNRPQRQDSVIGDLKLGWAYARQLGWVIPVSSCALVFNGLIAGTTGVLGPLLAADTIGAQGWGISRSGQAVGALVVTLFLGRLRLRRALVACLFGFALCAAPMIVLGTWLHTGALTLAFLISGMGFGIIDLAWNLTVQEKVTEDMLSRIMAIDGFFSFVAMPLGQLLVGHIIGLFTAQQVALASAAIMGLVALVGSLVPVIRRLELNAPAALATE